MNYIGQDLHVISVILAPLAYASTLSIDGFSEWLCMGRCLVQPQGEGPATELHWLGPVGNE